ncbi:uncharacterized protein TNCV_718121 [Trichonephila clavipes]|nr:uncharacterized protein TNCV_718121 [Trichonephila clavipes]
MHNATVQQHFTAVSLNSIPTIVMLQTEAGFISKYNVVSFHCSCPPAISPLEKQTHVVSIQRHLSVRDWLNITVLDQWIFRKGPYDNACFTWPPRSPDLTPWDFYLWRFIKDCVFVPQLSVDLPDLIYRIEAAVARIASDTMNKVWDELAYRLNVCRVTNGAFIEHL